MSKTIVSPVEEFPGTVKLPDRLTMPQVLAFEQSIKDSQALENGTPAEYDAIFLKAIFACVESVELDGYETVSEDNFPATPREKSAELIAWMFGSVLKLYNPEVPNE